jgi:class 3 adenylate cyclase
VTIVFCDVTGSTELGESLDPERLRLVLARYFERMKATVERHGGTVEKFIGDAVMAVFGLPVVHEDDALRALRAAVEMRDALPELGLQARIGVMTGEVVTGTEERLATGDAVNVAARLEQAAKPGTVLLGQATLELVRGSVDVEPVAALGLKGKRQPVPAFRLAGLRNAGERRHTTAFVGRERELARIRDLVELARAGRRCELVTIVGDAGVGKSRLVLEALGAVEAKIVRGRCLPYGESITYWPVVEVLKQLGVLPSDEAAAAVIRSLLGEAETATSAEEIAWAFRKTLEQAAAERLVIVVFDDIQWGEKTFHDLIEHVVLLSSGASALLICMARPELAERHPAWPVTLRLEPLTKDEVEDLIAARVSDELRARIAQAAGGNPLFVEEMLAIADESDGVVVVPPSLHALLETRLDNLEQAERRVLERAAIEGEVFHRAAVHALSPDGAAVTPHLVALVRKNVITPDKPHLAGEDGFRFRHLLLRDVAYEGLPKAVRADLHECYAVWLEQHGAELVELDEVLGYHLEQAAVYRVELGVVDDSDLAGRAYRRLAAGGRRAARRQDYGAAASLLGRAAALVPETEIDLVLEVELGAALWWTGAGDQALRRASDLTRRASAIGDRVSELCGGLQQSELRLPLEPEGAAEELVALVEEALPVFEAATNEMALFIANSALSTVEASRGQMSAALEAYERALGHAQTAGYLPHDVPASRAYHRFFGPTPASEVLAWIDENEPPAGRDHFLRAYRGGALAMLGRFDEARATLVETRKELAERGPGVLLANITAFESVMVERWAGNLPAAAEFASEAWRQYEELEEESFLPLLAANTAQVLYGLDRLDESDVWLGRAAAAGTDVEKEMLWRQVKAKVLARRGEHAKGERLAREAVAICERTDMLDAKGDAYSDFAEVLVLAGKRHEAADSLDQARKLYERKENHASERRVLRRLEELQDAASR